MVRVGNPPLQRFVNRINEPDRGSELALSRYLAGTKASTLASTAGNRLSHPHWPVRSERISDSGTRHYQGNFLDAFSSQQNSVFPDITAFTGRSSRKPSEFFSRTSQHSYLGASFTGKYLGLEAVHALHVPPQYLTGTLTGKPLPFWSRALLDVHKCTGFMPRG